MKSLIIFFVLALAVQAWNIPFLGGSSKLGAYSPEVGAKAEKAFNQDELKRCAYMTSEGLDRIHYQSSSYSGDETPASMALKMSSQLKDFYGEALKEDCEPLLSKYVALYKQNANKSTLVDTKSLSEENLKALHENRGYLLHESFVMLDNIKGGRLEGEMLIAHMGRTLD